MIGTKPDTAGATMRECADLGIARVWMHRWPAGGSVSHTACEYSWRISGSPLPITWSSTGAAGLARSVQQVDGQGGCPGEVFYPGMLASDWMVVLVEPALVH